MSRAECESLARRIERQWGPNWFERLRERGLVNSPGAPALGKRLLVALARDAADSARNPTVSHAIPRYLQAIEDRTSVRRRRELKIRGTYDPRLTAGDVQGHRPAAYQERAYQEQTRKRGGLVEARSAPTDADTADEGEGESGDEEGREPKRVRGEGDVADGGRGGTETLARETVEASEGADMSEASEGADVSEASEGADVSEASEGADVSISRAITSTSADEASVNEAGTGEADESVAVARDDPEPRLVLAALVPKLCSGCSVSYTHLRRQLR